MGEFSRLALIVGPLVCLWGLGHPISWNRAWTGDGAGPLLCILFWLAMSGIARRVSFDRSNDWKLAAGTTILATLSNWEWPHLNPWIYYAGLAWTVFLFAREPPLARSGNPLRRLRVCTAISIAVAAAVVAIRPERSASSYLWLGMVVLVVGLLGVVGVLLALPRHPLFARLARQPVGRLEPSWMPHVLAYAGVFSMGALRRADGGAWPVWADPVFFAPLVLLASAGMIARPQISARDASPIRTGVLSLAAFAGLVAAIVGVLPEGESYHVGTFETARFYALPFLLALFAILAWGVRSVGSRLLRGNVANSIRTWHVIFLVALAGNCDAWPLVIAGGLVALSASALASSENASHRSRVSLALAPLLLPLLCFACLRQLDTPAEWHSVVAPRGQIGAISELLAVPLLGAALVVAWQLDALCNRGTSAIAGWIGVALLALCVASHESLPDWGQRRIFTPVGNTHILDALDAAGLPIRPFWSATACMVLAGALYAVLRIRLESAKLWPLLLLVVIAAVVSASTIPEHGPVAALWASTIAVPIAASVEWIAALRRPRSPVFDIATP